MTAKDTFRFTHKVHTYAGQYATLPHLFAFTSPLSPCNHLPLEQRFSSPPQVALKVCREHGAVNDGERCSKETEKRLAIWASQTSGVMELEYQGWGR